MSKNSSNITGAQALALLKEYDKYKGKTDYQIKKEIGGSKPAVVKEIRDELAKLQKRSVKSIKETKQKDIPKKQPEKSKETKSPKGGSKKRSTKPEKSKSKDTKKARSPKNTPKKSKPTKVRAKKPREGMVVMIWDKESYDFAMQHGDYNPGLGSNSDTYISREAKYVRLGTFEEVDKSTKALIKIVRAHLKIKGDNVNYTDDYLVDNVLRNMPGELYFNEHIAYIEAFPAVSV